MKKVLSLIALAAILILGIALLDHSLAYAANCGNVFPTSLNNYVSGCTIPSAWGNALESKIGVTSSTVTSSLDYEINHIFTSHGSEVIATSALPSSVTTSTPSFSGLTVTGITNLATTSMSYANFGALSLSTPLSAANGGTGTTTPLSSNAFSTATIPTSYVSSFNGATGTVTGVSSINSATGTYLIVAGSNITISTSSTSTTINASGGGSSGLPLLYTTTTVANATSVTITSSSVPFSSWPHMEIFMTVPSITAADQEKITFNGSAAAQYAYQMCRGLSCNTAQSAQTSILLKTNADTPGSDFDIKLFNPTSTSVYREFIDNDVTTGAGSYYSLGANNSVSGLWATSTPITGITFGMAGTGNYATGTIISFYGYSQ